MKKGLLLVIFIFVLLVTLAFTLVEAQDNATITDFLFKTKQNASSSIKNLLESGVSLPEAVQPVIRLFFGLEKDEKLSLQNFVIMAAIFLAVFVVVMHVLRVIPLFGGGLRSFFGGLAVALLIGITGALRQVAIFFLNLGDLFGIAQKSGFFIMVLALIIVFIFVYGAMKILAMLRKSEELETAEQKGRDLAMLEAKAKAKKNSPI